MEDEIIESRVESTNEEKCIERFKDLWSADELKEKIIPDMNPRVLEIYRRGNISITNHSKLAKILFDSVGPKFFIEIENNVDKRRKFLKTILESAISKNIIKEKELTEFASKKNPSYYIRTIPNIVNLPVASRWIQQLAMFLGFSSSTSTKESTETFIPHEPVLPTLDLNPLYDYQHSTGLEVRKMLEGKIEIDKLDHNMFHGGVPTDKRILISVPTGSGKTRMIVETLIEWLNDGKPSINKQQRDSKFILWIAQSHELCEQAISSFKTTFQARGKRGTVLHLHRYWGTKKGKDMPITAEKLSDEYNERAIVVSSIQSLHAIFNKSPQIIERLSDVTSCIVIDEAHHSIADSYNDLLTGMGFNLGNKKQEMSLKGIILVGLTATPFRGSGDNIETDKLRRRYGRTYFPSIHYYEGDDNAKPHALIDCQSYAMVGHGIRIIGERSYDRDGFITDNDFNWKISKVKKIINIYSKNKEKDVSKNQDWTIKKLKNIDFVFPSEGEYKISLEVTDNEKQKAESAVYVTVIPKKEEEYVDEDKRQKSLYKKLIQRQILCDVHHWILKSKKINLNADDYAHLVKFKEFRPETITALGHDMTRNKLIIDTIHDLKVKHKRNKILFFGCSIEHSREIAQTLKIMHNMDARYIDSNTGIDQRVDTIEQFKNGSVEVLCNYNILTTGFDAPNIDSVFVGRPMRSTLMYTQIIGRGLRGLKSGGTENVLLVDIDDNFQLDPYAGSSENITAHTALGWKVFSEYWESFNPDKTILKQTEVPPEKLYTITCTTCGNTGTGIEDIERVFGPIDDVDELIQYIENDESQKIPSHCKECREQEIEKIRVENELQIDTTLIEEIEPSKSESSDTLSKEKLTISRDEFIKIQSSAGIDPEISAKQYDEKYGNEITLKICPRCNIEANVEDIFGYRTINGKQKPQSYCRKCRIEELKINKNNICPFVGYLENQNNIQGNYQMIMGLYALGTQNGSLPSANMKDACDVLLQHNPEKTHAQINKDHSVFEVYYRNGLITRIDAVSGKISFKKILDPEKFEKICTEKLTDYKTKQKLKEEKQVPSELESSEIIDNHFYKLKNLVFGHVPTLSQYNQSTSKDLQTLMNSLYRRYDLYLESKGESVRDDPHLQDTLFDEYFELYHLAKSTVTKEMLDEYGNFRLSDYIECFGTYEHFDSVITEIILKTKEITPSITIDDLFVDYDRIMNDIGRTPHFEEIRKSSYLGIEYYLHYFGTLGKFIKISKLKPEDRYLINQFKNNFYQLKKLLGVIPNFRQIKLYSEYVHKFDTISNAKNYEQFIVDLGENQKPHDDDDHESITKICNVLSSKFISNIERFGREKAIKILFDEDPISYTEWFESKEKFIEQNSIGDDLLEMFKIRKQQIISPKENLDKKFIYAGLSPITSSVDLHCPDCNSELSKFDGGVACLNKKCGYYKTNQ